MVNRRGLHRLVETEACALVIAALCEPPEPWLFPPTAAGAKLVYGRAHHRIVVARNNGTHARVIARGRQPAIAPNGRRVACLGARSGRRGPGRDLRVIGVRGGRSRRVLRAVGPVI
jgi:hypothetical protein